jgi:hypothetical protein
MPHIKIWHVISAECVNAQKWAYTYMPKHSAQHEKAKNIVI